MLGVLKRVRTFGRKYWLCKPFEFFSFNQITKKII